MGKRKILSVYFDEKIGEEANLNIDIELNLNGLISENDIEKILTNEEITKINGIVLNLVKRANEINSKDEFLKI